LEISVLSFELFSVSSELPCHFWSLHFNNIKTGQRSVTVALPNAISHGFFGPIQAALRTNYQGAAFEQSVAVSFDFYNTGNDQCGVPVAHPNTILVNHVILKTVGYSPMLRSLA
jgi:hypothetical protein